MDRFCGIFLRHGFSMALLIGTFSVLFLGMLILWRGDGPALPGDRLGHTASADVSLDQSDSQAHEGQENRRLALLGALRTDAARFDVPVEAERFLAPFPAMRTEGRWVLHGRGGRLVSRELRVTTGQRSLTTPLGDLGTYKAPHVVLTVENRTDRYIAFRVDTIPSGLANCSPKAVLPQTTMVLGPREALSRTECLAKGVDRLTVERLEVMEVPPLSYHYLLKVRPVALGLSARISEGHRLPAGRQHCAGAPRQDIEQALRSGAASWFDVIDFYARHSCERHAFYSGYRRVGPPPTVSPILESTLAE